MIAKYKSLKNLFNTVGMSFVQTNQYPQSIKKNHLLEMRRDDLVFYVDASNPMLGHYSIKPFGPDKNANYYSITIKGLLLLKKEAPELADEINEELKFFFDFVFEEDGYLKKYIIKHRLGITQY